MYRIHYEIPEEEKDDEGLFPLEKLPLFRGASRRHLRDPYSSSVETWMKGDALVMNDRLLRLVLDLCYLLQLRFCSN